MLLILTFMMRVSHALPMPSHSTYSRRVFVGTVDVKFLGESPFDVKIIKELFN